MQKQFLWGQTVLNGELLMAFMLWLCEQCLWDRPPHSLVGWAALCRLL